MTNPQTDKATEALGQLHTYVMGAVDWSYDDGTQFEAITGLFDTVSSTLTQSARITELEAQLMEARRLAVPDGLIQQGTMVYNPKDYAIVEIEKINQIIADNQIVIDLYNRTGPDMTMKKTGSEWYDALYVLAKAQENIDALEALRPFLKAGG